MYMKETSLKYNCKAWWCPTEYEMIWKIEDEAKNIGKYKSIILSLQQ